MKNNQGQINIVLGFGVLAVMLIAAALVLPWKMVNWGRIEWATPQTVTVTGTAKSTQKNQIASFTAGVNIIKDKKEDAVAETNQKISALVEAVKKFGIPAADIKTQNVSVYQQQEPVYMMDSKVAPVKRGGGQWVVNNSIEITLRDVDKASALTDLLNSSGANNVYGPNFRMDNTSNIEKSLYDGAIQDARERAAIIAKSSGRKLGKVVSVNEGAGGVNPVYPMMAKTAGMGGGAVTEVGTENVSQSLVVSFELN